MKTPCWYGLILGIVFFLTGPLTAQEKTLAEALGYSNDARVLIVNADDFGMCHAENMGTKKVLEYGVVTSATMMMPCPWILEAVEYAKHNQLSNIGVHVTLTSEWGRYRWRPISASEIGKSSLLDERGYMWAGSEEVALYADIAEVKREVRAQLHTAVALGVNLSHFDSHMGSLYGIHGGRWELLAVALSHSYEYGLPFRLPYMEELKSFRQMGFAILDHLIMGIGAPNDPEARKQYFLKTLRELPAGVSELYIHPALDTEELRHITNSAKTRQAEVDIFCDPEIKDAVHKYNIRLITYEPLKRWQRAQMNWKSGLNAEDVYEQYLRILKKNLPLRGGERFFVEEGQE